MKRVRYKKAEYARIRKAMHDAARVSAKVGVLAKEGSDEATKAAANEFGTERNPERSFLRSTFAMNQQEYAKALRNAVEAIYDGTASPQKALSIVAMRAASDVQQTIVNLRDPPNAPATIEKKGSSNPLIDQGRLLQSISYDVFTK